MVKLEDKLFILIISIYKRINVVFFFLFNLWVFYYYLVLYMYFLFNLFIENKIKYLIYVMIFSKLFVILRCIWNYIYVL